MYDDDDDDIRMDRFGSWEIKYIYIVARESQHTDEEEKKT